eukprot:731834-Hanusia_phi.AAC.1
MNFVAADWGPSDGPSPDSLALSSEPAPPGPRVPDPSRRGPLFNLIYITLRQLITSCLTSLT